MPRKLFFQLGDAFRRGLAPQYSAGVHYPMALEVQEWPQDVRPLMEPERRIRENSRIERDARMLDCLFDHHCTDEWLTDDKEITVGGLLYVKSVADAAAEQA